MSSPATCHLWADTEDELLDFAEKIGLPWSWVQRSKGRYSLLHFDLVASMRARAVSAGAIELTFREAVQKWEALKPVRTAAPRKLQLVRT